MSVQYGLMNLYGYRYYFSVINAVNNVARALFRSAPFISFRDRFQQCISCGSFNLHLNYLLPINRFELTEIWERKSN